MVALLDLLVLAPGIPPVPVKDECDVLRYGACGEDGDEGIAGLGVDLGAEPAEGRGDELESHVVGNGLASRRVSLLKSKLDFDPFSASSTNTPPPFATPLYDPTRRLCSLGCLGREKR